MNRLITIVGPTAVGKTELTLRLAHEFQSPIISGDAYQVYKQLNIGTAKPTAEELASAQHYLIDILEPDDSYSVSVFQEQVKQLMNLLNPVRHAEHRFLAARRPLTDLSLAQFWVSVIEPAQGRIAGQSLSTERAAQTDFGSLSEQKPPAF